MGPDVERIVYVISRLRCSCLGQAETGQAERCLLILNSGHVQVKQRDFFFPMLNTASITTLLPVPKLAAARDSLAVHAQSTLAAQVFMRFCARECRLMTLRASH